MRLFHKKLKIKRLKREYESILEKFPEGVLITDAKKNILFMNQELHQFLNVTTENQDHGLYVPMFRKYKSDESLKESIDLACKSESLLTILEDPDVLDG